MVKSKEKVGKSTPTKMERKRNTVIGFVREGYSLDKALELTGYSIKTIEHERKRTLEALGLDEILISQLKTKTNLANNLAMNLCIEIMADEDREDHLRLKAAEVAVKEGNIHYKKEEGRSIINFMFQTNIDKQMIKVGKENE